LSIPSAFLDRPHQESIVFHHTSRYYSLETAQHDTADGRKIAYKRRRFIPQGQDLPLLREAKVAQGDRLDLITYDSLGDPEQFWQVCDANDAMNPEELTAEVGRALRIPAPQASGGV
jgi:hypothetical protein